MERLRGRIVPIGVCVLGLFLGGCRAAAPIHVWAPPAIESTVGKRVAIAPLAGDPQIAGPLHRAMLSRRPRDLGRVVEAIDAAALERGQEIRLASATTNEASDIALLNLARRSGIDFVLQGEIIPQRGGARPRTAARPDPMLPSRPDEPNWNTVIDRQQQQQQEADEASTLTVSWKLIDLSGNLPPSGQPVVTRRPLGQPAEAMINAAAEAAWELMVPHVVAEQTQLSAPRLALGASAVRRGNAAAAHGDWQQAQQIWEEVLRQRPRQHAAMHNLAIAAVARQDYPEARHWIAQALRSGHSPLYQSTAVWIEQRQRDYHVAFGLPDPPGGWAATSR